MISDNNIVEMIEKLVKIKNNKELNRKIKEISEFDEEYKILKIIIFRGYKNNCVNGQNNVI